MVVILSLNRANIRHTSCSLCEWPFFSFAAFSAFFGDFEVFGGKSTAEAMGKQMIVMIAKHRKHFCLKRYNR